LAKRSAADASSVLSSRRGRAYDRLHRLVLEFATMPPTTSVPSRAGGIFAMLLSFILATASPCSAGGGPENVFLVVNARSWSSLTVANHFIRLRKIPFANVLYVDWPYDNEQIDAETMRAKLLGPIIEEIGRRNIADHIDYVVYSTDFPWAVDLSSETKGLGMSQYLTPVASLNGATYLYQKFLTRQLEFLMLDANKYFRPLSKTGPPESQAFRSWYGWGKDGKLLEAGGERFLLSMMLGVTSGRGSSTDEVVRYLTRSVGADFTRPNGTIYYARNDDVRSTTRQDLFPAAVAALERLDVKAAIVQGKTPQHKADVMGAMLGTDQFSWREAHCDMRPGAICEHLTSTGGVMSEGAGQTPLTEWLANGAAGTSGAVTEPFAIPHKFPNAFLHLHYARGCSLAEAFYQSVYGPYQLLIVGDPLCRPWADPPRVSVVGLEANARVQGTATLKPSAKMPAGSFVARYELYVDGVLTSTCESGETLAFDSQNLPDGYHELRVMAVSGEPIETRGGLLIPIKTTNRNHTLELARVGDGPVRFGEPLRLKVKTAEAVGIIVAQGSRTLARVHGNEGEITLDPQVLGLGPVTLQAAAVGASGHLSNVLSLPLELEVQPAPLMPSYQIRGGAQFSPGMRLAQDDGETRTILSTYPDTWLTEQGVKPGEGFQLRGFFTVDRDGEFQFQIRHKLKIALVIDDRVVFERPTGDMTLEYIPLSLQHGLHKIELRGTASDDPRLDVRFGYRGMQRLKPAAMTHIP
jgi:hypothetical protein